MCKWISRVIAVVLVCASSIASAQQPRTLDARRAALIESHAKLMQLLNLVRQDSIRRATLPVGREYAGMKLRVDTLGIPREFIETLDDAYNTVVKDAARTFGSAAHALLSNLSGSIVRGASWEPLGERETSRFVSMSLESVPGSGSWAQALDAYDATEAMLARSLTEWFGRAAYAQWPSPVQAWAARPFSIIAETRDAGAYSDVAQARVEASRACLDGKLQACRALMAIEPGNDTLGSWMTNEEIRSFVSRFRLGYWRRTRDGVDLGERQARCTVGNDDAACRDMLRLMRVAGPVDGYARARLVLLALELGGPDAFDRLRGSRENHVGTILAATAGVSLDSLLTVWHARMIAARPHSPAPDGREILVGCLLIIGTLAISVGRRP